MSAHLTSWTLRFSFLREFLEDSNQPSVETEKHRTEPDADLCRWIRDTSRSSLLHIYFETAQKCMAFQQADHDHGKENDMKVSTTELYKYDMTYKKIQTENQRNPLIGLQ